MKKLIICIISALCIFNETRAQEPTIPLGGGLPVRATRLYVDQTIYLPFKGTLTVLPKRPGAIETKNISGLAEPWFWDGTTWKKINIGTQVTTLSSLNDVVITALATGHTLVWNGTNWVNTPAGGGGGGAETDPIYGASPAGTITSTNITNWNSAFSWGNHATAGYLTNTTGDVRYYTKTNLQTSGQASVHWNNITNLPTFATQYTDEMAQDAVAAALSSEFTYNDPTNAISINAIAASKITGTKNIDFIADFPGQTGNGGKALTTNGTSLSWISFPTGGDAFLGNNQTFTGVNTFNNTIRIGDPVNTITGTSGGMTISNASPSGGNITFKAGAAGSIGLVVEPLGAVRMPALSAVGNVLGVGPAGLIITTGVPYTSIVRNDLTYSNPSWITSLSETKVLPSQSGNAGKILTTNGTITSWGTALTGPYWTLDSARKYLDTLFLVNNPLHIRLGMLPSLDTLVVDYADPTHDGVITASQFVSFTNKLSNITGLVTAGTNVTITGSGTIADPYVVNSAGGGGGSGSPGGANTQIQFNDVGSFNGESTFTYDKTNNRVGIGSTGPTFGLDVRHPENGATARFYNPTSTTGITYVEIQGGAANPVTGTANPLLNFKNNAGTQVAFIRADGLGAFSIVATTDDATAAMGQAGGLVAPGLNLKNTSLVVWSSDAFWYGTEDVGLGRNAAGVLEINNGTLGTYRDAKFRDLTLTGRAGTGTRMLVVNASGVVSDQAIPTGGGSEVDPVFTASVAAGIVAGDITNWNQAYNKYTNSAAVTGTGTKTMTFTRRDGTTYTANWTDQGITAETDPLSILNQTASDQAASFRISGTGQAASYSAVGNDAGPLTQLTLINGGGGAGTGSKIQWINGVATIGEIYTYLGSGGSNNTMRVSVQGNVVMNLYGANQTVELPGYAGTTNRVLYLDASEIIQASTFAPADVVLNTGSYANPSWITSLALSKSTTAITGLLKGNGTGVVVAVAGTDYQVPQSTLAGYGITDALTTSLTSTQDAAFNTIRLRDIVNPSHYMIIRNNSDYTANRTLNIVTGDIDRTLTMAGDANISGTNTGDQTITLTGPVTGSGQGSFATSITSHSITNAMIRQSGALSVVGNISNATADVGDISAGTDGFILRRSGTALGFGQLTAGGIAGTATNGNAIVLVAGVPTWTALASGGSVTTVSVVNANGFNGSVANASTTPAITLTTTVTGLLKGNGTAISAAVSGTDYVAPQTTLAGYGITDALSSSLSSTQAAAFSTIRLKDVTNPSHYMIIRNNSDYTADRTLNIVTGDADRTLTMAGDANISGTNTGDQTITLTGDVTGTGVGSFATAIGARKVTYAMMPSVADNRLLGRSAGSAGDAMEISLGSGLLLSAGVLSASGVLYTASDGLNVLSNDVRLGGPLNSNTTITGASGTYILSLGASSDRLNSFNIYANGSIKLDASLGYIQENGQVQRAMSNTVDANSTISDISNITTLITITANRTLTFPSNGAGKTFTLMNVNSSNFKWTIVGTGVRDVDGNTLTEIPNQSAMTFINDGTNWVLTQGKGSYLNTGTGTTTISPLQFAVGTNSSLETVSEAGDVEIDAGGQMYYTPKSGGTAATAERGYVIASQLLTTSSNFALTAATTTLQPCFPAANDAVQLSAATTYRFRFMYYGTRTSSATAASMRTGFTYSGTLSGTPKYWVNGAMANVNGNTSGQSIYINSLAATNATNSGTSVTNFVIKGEGEFRTSTAGLLVPSLGQSVSTGVTALSIDAESYFEIWPVGTSSVVSVGTGQ
jgi:hypothetical protein